MFTVTVAWIEAFKTPNGGWKRRQLEQIGIKWPPAKGWKDQAVGMSITDENRRIFEAFSQREWHERNGD